MSDCEPAFRPLRSSAAVSLLRLVRLLVVVASTILVAGCSLMGLDEFGLDPCQTDRDCHVLGHGAAPEGTACYRCEQRQCVRDGQLDDESAEWVEARSDVPVVAGPATVSASEGHPLLDHHQ